MNLRILLLLLFLNVVIESRFHPDQHQEGKQLSQDDPEDTENIPVEVNIENPKRRQSKFERTGRRKNNQISDENKVTTTTIRIPFACRDIPRLSTRKPIIVPTAQPIDVKKLPVGPSEPPTKPFVLPGIHVGFSGRQMKSVGSKEADTSNRKLSQEKFDDIIGGLSKLKLQKSSSDQKSENNKYEHVRTKRSISDQLQEKEFLDELIGDLKMLAQQSEKQKYGKTGLIHSRIKRENKDNKPSLAEQFLSFLIGDLSQLREPGPMAVKRGEESDTKNLYRLPFPFESPALDTLDYLNRADNFDSSDFIKNVITVDLTKDDQDKFSKVNKNQLRTKTTAINVDFNPLSWFTKFTK